MSFEMMCFVTVIVMGVAIAIYGFIKVNGGVQPKMAAKQAPPHFTMGSNSMYINHPLPHPTAFNTSSNFTFPIQTGRPIGKPLVIQNWDRLIGMIFPISISNSQYGNWIVTRAGQTTDGYECMFENGGGFGNSNRAVTLTVYSDIYDLNRVMVKCGGRMSTMNIETFKDPNNMLYTIANEFQEKFR
jgi:hypothetical protein